MKNIAIIGNGKVGSALHLGLVNSGHKVWVFERNALEGTARLREKNLDTLQAVDVILIAVPDAEIKSVVAVLNHLNLQNKTVAHTSGALAASALQSLKGTHYGSLHPVQTFNRRELPPDIWHNTICTFEGSTQAATVLDKLCAGMGVKMVLLNAEQKAALHCAAVFAANYQVALLQAAEKICRTFEVNKDLLQPLIKQVQRNFINHPAAEILSGPLQRGDTQTVHRHLQLLVKNNLSSEADLYKQLARYILEENEFNLGAAKDMHKALED